MGMTKVKWMGVCLDYLGVFWKLKQHIGVKVAKEDFGDQDQRRHIEGVGKSFHGPSWQCLWSWVILIHFKWFTK